MDEFGVGAQAEDIMAVSQFRVYMLVTLLTSVNTEYSYSNAEYRTH